MNCHEAQPLLNAYSDGELDLVRTLELEGHVHDCSVCAAQLETQKQLSAAIGAAPYYRAPAALRARIDSSAPSLWRRPPMWFALAASVIIALVVTGRWTPSDSTGDQIVQAHARALRTGHLFDVAASAGHTVRPWFAGKLDYPLNVEDISSRGFVLAGGRLDSLNGRTVAVLVYQRGSHVVNVFVWPAGQQNDQAPTARAAGSFNLVNWRADGMNWWAVSDLDLPELEELPLCPCFMPVHDTLRG